MRIENDDLIFSRGLALLGVHKAITKHQKPGSVTEVKKAAPSAQQWAASRGKPKSRLDPGQLLNSFDLVDHGLRAGERNLMARLWQEDQA